MANLDRVKLVSMACHPQGVWVAINFNEGFPYLPNSPNLIEDKARVAEVEVVGESAA
jgi:hypothetical protein